MTAEVYRTAVQRIEATWPDHPLLGALQNHTLLNERRVVAIIQQMAEQERQEAEEEATYAAPLDDDSPDVLALFMRQSNLFVQRAKYSNRLHECSSDRERSEVVDCILDTQRQIEDVMATIRHYRATGAIPDTSTGYRIPTDGAELVRLQNSLRVMISQQRRKVRELMEMEQNVTVKNKMEAADKAIKDYQLHLIHVQKEIERRGKVVHSE